MKVKVYRPINQEGLYHHNNDSFRELLEIWEELEYIELIEYDGKHVWMNDIGDVLLYDRPTLDWLEPDLKYNIGLFGNPELPKNGKHNHHWIFWARHPKILDTNIKTRKTNNTVFIGNVENTVQLQYRDTTWEDVIDRFEIILGKEHKYENQEYLKIIGSYKYGLCLRGYGQKCHREIELMKFGTVPILTKGCNTDYYNQLEEDVHYIKVNSPEELIQKLQIIETKDYKKMSSNCKKWYEKNCSSEGSFKVTMEIIKSNQKKLNKLESICTMVTKNSEHDFIQFINSIKNNFKNINLYVICDSYINNLYQETGFTFLNKLDKYQTMTREQMEQNGLWLEFMLMKTEVIDYALKECNNTLFVDSDVYFLNSKLEIDFEKQVGLSPHYISNQEQEKYGKYNAGFIYVSDTDVTKYWREVDHEKFYFEQGILNTFPDMFESFEFNENNNFGFWRLNNVDNIDEVIGKLKLLDGKYYFNDKELNSLHIHQFDPKYKNFTTIFKVPIYTLIVQYYNDSNPERQKELDTCILQNLDNPLFKKVINLSENETQVPENIKNHPKYFEFKIGKRITYQDVINYCNQELKYETVVIGNLDIIYTNQTNLTVSKNEVVALSRVENNNYNLFMSMSSQDSWVMVPPLNIDNCNFEIGSLGCDNAFADRVMKSGLKILNRGTKFLNIHLDQVRNQEQKQKQYLRNNAMDEGYLLIPDYDNLMELEINKNDYKIKLEFINQVLSNQTIN
jgi:hypothetical protein